MTDKTVQNRDWSGSLLNGRKRGKQKQRVIKTGKRKYEPEEDINLDVSKARKYKKGGKV